MRASSARLVAAGSAAILCLGAGTTALLLEQPAGARGTPVAISHAHTPAQHGARHGTRHRHHLLRHVRGIHGEWVTRSKSGFVTHQAIRGTLSAVSPGSVTIKAADGRSITFTLSPQTKVRVRQPHHQGKDGSLSQAAVGMRAAAVGRGSDKPSARVVVVRLGSAKAGTTS